MQSNNTNSFSGDPIPGDFRSLIERCDHQDSLTEFKLKWVIDPDDLLTCPESLLSDKLHLRIDYLTDAQFSACIVDLKKLRELRITDEQPASLRTESERMADFFSFDIRRESLSGKRKVSDRPQNEGGNAVRPNVAPMSFGRSQELGEDGLFKDIIACCLMLKRKPSHREFRNFVRTRQEYASAELKRFFSLSNLAFILQQFSVIFRIFVEYILHKRITKRACSSTARSVNDLGHSFENVALEVENAVRKLFLRNQLGLHFITGKIPNPSDEVYIAGCLMADESAQRLIELISESLSHDFDFVVVWEIGDKCRGLHLHAYLPYSLPLTHQIVADCWLEVLRGIRTATGVSPFLRDTYGQEQEVVDVTLSHHTSASSPRTYISKPEQKTPRCIPFADGKSVVLSPCPWALISPGLLSKNHLPK